MRHALLVSSTILLAIHSTSAAPRSNGQLAGDIYRELVETDTSQSTGDTLRAANEMAARLLAAGFPKDDVHVFETAPKRGDLVARYRGTGKQKPIILMGHLDVVEARRSDWSTDPFKLVEQDGYYYGRGSIDDKAMVAALVTDLVRLRQEHFKPDRDVVLILETDEEISDVHNLGITWLLDHHKELFGDAEFALNEGGFVGMKNGKPLWNSIQTTEKLFQSYWLETRNAGGHSSQPRKDNAIYELAAALGKLAQFEFPVELSDTTRAYFTTMASFETGPAAADMKSVVSAHPDPAAVARVTAQPPYNAQLRTTCVATRLEGGHADNALPQLARAMVNCRILPGHTAEETQKTLEQAIGDPHLTITMAGHDVTSQPAAAPPVLVHAIEKLTPRFFGKIPVLPTMSAGATDGRYLRNAGIPCYGHSGMAGDIFESRAHGKDERLLVRSYANGTQYLYELIKLLAGGS